jgi:hypothetical protein
MQKYIVPKWARKPLQSQRCSVRLEVRGDCKAVDEMFGSLRIGSLDLRKMLLASAVIVLLPMTSRAQEWKNATGEPGNFTSSMSNQVQNFKLTPDQQAALYKDGNPLHGRIRPGDTPQQRVDNAMQDLDWAYKNSARQGGLGNGEASDDRAKEAILGLFQDQIKDKVKDEVKQAVVDPATGKVIAYFKGNASDASITFINKFGKIIGVVGKAASTAQIAAALNTSSVTGSDQVAHAQEVLRQARQENGPLAGIVGKQIHVQNPPANLGPRYMPRPLAPMTMLPQPSHGPSGCIGPCNAIPH